MFFLSNNFNFIISHFSTYYNFQNNKNKEDKKRFIENLAFLQKKE